MESVNVDVAVIGAGPGGYVAAIRLAQLGKKVALIEKERLGGICLNVGCIPSKALIHAADFLSKAKKAGSMGIMIGNVSVDFAKMQSWKDGVVDKLVKGIEFLCKSGKITVIRGKASFLSSNSLSAETADGKLIVEFGKAIIATGSMPIEIPSLKFGKDIISSTEALSLDTIPKSLVVVGGGYIGLELGTVYAKLGSKVHVVEMTSQLLPGFDSSIVQIIQKNLESMGVSIYLDSKAEKFNSGKLTISAKEGSREIEADKVLVAVGRVPNTKALGLEKTKAQLDEKGFVKVDSNLKTADGNIYAIGDISLGPMLAHKASYQGKFVAEIISGHRKAYEESLVPSVIFTDPEIATVGISEKEAMEKNLKVKIGKFPFSAIGRAATKNATEGFVRIIADSKNIILGVEIVGADASDLISEAALAIKKKATLEELATTIHPHPTMSESLMEAAEATMGKAIHILNPK